MSLEGPSGPLALQRPEPTRKLCAPSHSQGQGWGLGGGSRSGELAHWSWAWPGCRVPAQGDLQPCRRGCGEGGQRLVPCTRALPNGCSCKLGTVSPAQWVYQCWKTLTTTTPPPLPLPSPTSIPDPSLSSTQSEIQHRVPLMTQLISY